MSTEGKTNLSHELRQVVDSRISFNEIGIGGTVIFIAEDARTREQNELHLQLVAFHQFRNNKEPRPVFSILTDNFSLHAPAGLVFGPVKSGTLCIGGLAMTWLPQPIYGMVGIGGPDVGRDFSLENVGGEWKVAVIHRIIQLDRVEAPADFIPPDALASFCQKVERLMREHEESDSPETQDQRKKEAISRISANLNPAPEWLTDELAMCHLEGIAAIASFLYLSKEQGQLEEAFTLVQKGFRDQWSYQPPTARAHPWMGSNGHYLAELYRKAMLVIPKQASKQETTPNQNGDEAYQAMRRALELGGGENFEERDNVSLASLGCGQMVIVETQSGNRYALKVINPQKGEVSAMALKHREGAPDDGFMPSVIASDLRVGSALNTSAFCTSAISVIRVCPAVFL